MLSRTDIWGTMPSALRSSGSSAVPAASDAPGDPVRTCRPPTRTVPRSRRCVPKIAFTVSERPEPSRPASPTTSPLCTASATSCSWWRRSSPTASRTTSVPITWSRVKLVRPSDRTSATSRPSIVAITSSLVVSAIGAGARPAPVAQDRDPVGDREHLVEVVADEEQGHAGGASGDGSSRRPERPRAARATTSARRGSPHARSVETARTMAIICCTPAPNDTTGRRTSMSMP